MPYIYSMSWRTNAIKSLISLLVIVNLYSFDFAIGLDLVTEQYTTELVTQNRLSQNTTHYDVLINDTPTKITFRFPEKNWKSYSQLNVENSIIQLKIYTQKKIVLNITSLLLQIAYSDIQIQKSHSSYSC